jgi:hypothetical protein
MCFSYTKGHMPLLEIGCWKIPTTHFVENLSIHKHKLKSNRTKMILLL